MKRFDLSSVWNTIVVEGSFKLSSIFRSFSFLFFIRVLVSMKRQRNLQLFSSSALLLIVYSSISDSSSFNFLISAYSKLVLKIWATPQCLISKCFLMVRSM